MTAHALRTRRMVLRDMGKAGLGLLVLGTAACADETGDQSSISSASNGTSTTPEPDAGSTSQADTTSTQAETTSTSPAPAGLDWQRVNLDFVSAYILFRAGEAALVDTGVGGSEGAIEAVLTEVGLDWGTVGHVVVTHKHPDHQGSLEGVLAQAPGASWYAGEGDMSAISAPGAGMAVGDGDSVFDLQIIETPGHTPGHIAVLDAAGGVLVAGDALNGTDGGLTGANPGFSEDMGLANASVQKLAGFDYEVVLFGHGEPVLEGGSAAVADLAGTIG